jgi:hypothetical protein
MGQQHRSRKAKEESGRKTYIAELASRLDNSNEKGVALL